MKVLLIAANTEKMNVIPLPIGLHYVAAATERGGHDVRVLDLMTHEDASSSIEEAVGAWSPQVIGISVRNIDDQNREQPKFLLPLLKPTIDHCRRLSSAPIVLGGAGYSIFPEAALTYLGASMGIQGEGEVAFLTLLDRLEKGEPLTGVPGLYIQGQGLQASRSYIRNFSEQLTSGFERFTSTYDRQLWVPFQTRRGCPLDCSYCSTATIEGRLVRKRPLTSAMAELIALRNQGFRHFFFVDNTFNLPLSYAKNCAALSFTTASIFSGAASSIPPRSMTSSLPLWPRLAAAK